jgi:hypothetical protein
MHHVVKSLLAKKAVFIDRFMHYTGYRFLKTIAQTGRKETGRQVDFILKIKGKSMT